MYYDLWAYTPSTFTLNWTPLLSNPTTHHYLTCQDLCSFLVQHCLWIPSKTQPVAPVFRHHRMIPRANELKLPLRIWRNLRSLFWWGFFCFLFFSFCFVLFCFCFLFFFFNKGNENQLIHTVPSLGHRARNEHICNNNLHTPTYFPRIEGCLSLRSRTGHFINRNTARKGSSALSVLYMKMLHKLSSFFPWYLLFH